MEAWLTGYLRAVLKGRGLDAQVGNKEPPDLGTRLPLLKPLVVIRDDSGPWLEMPTFDCSIGVSVLAGTRLNDKPANDLAQVVAGVLQSDRICLVDGSPIAAVVRSGSTGPVAVPERVDVARRYFTAQYVGVGVSA